MEKKVQKRKTGVEKTYTSATTETAATATTPATSAAAVGGPLASLCATGALVTAGTSFLVLLLLLLLQLLLLIGLASKLDGDLTLEDFLAGQSSNSILSLLSGGKVDKGVANRAVSARIHRDRGALSRSSVLVGGQRKIINLTR